MIFIGEQVIDPQLECRADLSKLAVRPPSNGIDPQRRADPAPAGLNFCLPNSLFTDGSEDPAHAPPPNTARQSVRYGQR